MIAGVTVAAIAIPESLGYAKIAGLPIQTGLYCALLPALMFALIGSSRQLVVGADSATAALVAAGAGLVAAQGTAEYASAVGVLAILTAVFLLLFAVAKLEFLADLISQPVLAGFLSGVGVSLIIGNLSGMLGVPASGSTWDKLTQTLSELDQANWTTAALAFGTVIVMLGLEEKMPKLPGRAGVADPVQRDGGGDRCRGQRRGERRGDPRRAARLHRPGRSRPGSSPPWRPARSRSRW